MSITDQQYTEWLASDDAQPVILVEATHSAGVEYVASAPFVSGASDTPANTSYADILIGDVESNDRLDSAAIGDLLLVNDGSLDSWLDLDWRRYALKVFLGDVAWSRDDFRLVIDGINGGIEAPDNDRLEWVLYDRTETLRVSVGDVLAPIVLGKVYNCKPVLIDAVTLTYKVHDGAVTSITVRDNGIEVTPATVDLANGEFNFGANQDPAGQVTCDVVQADQSAADIVDELCTRAGISVDSANLTAFPNAAALGLYIDQPSELEGLLSAVLSSVGATYRFNALGELQIFRLEAPATATLKLNADDIVERGVRLSTNELPVNIFTLGYRKNWSPQSADSLSTSLTATQKRDFEVDYLTVTKDNAKPLAQDRRVDTLIDSQTDAQSECDRRAALRSVQRRAWTVTGFLSASEVSLGETVNLTYPALGWSAGRDARVIGINKRVGKRRMELTLWA